MRRGGENAECTYHDGHKEEVDEAGVTEVRWNGLRVDYGSSDVEQGGDGEYETGEVVQDKPDLTGDG